MALFRFGMKRPNLGGFKRRSRSKARRGVTGTSAYHRCVSAGTKGVRGSDSRRRANFGRVSSACARKVGKRSYR